MERKDSGGAHDWPGSSDDADGAGRVRGCDSDRRIRRSTEQLCMMYMMERNGNSMMCIDNNDCSIALHSST